MSYAPTDSPTPLSPQGEAFAHQRDRDRDERRKRCRGNARRSNPWNDEQRNRDWRNYRESGYGSLRQSWTPPVDEYGASWGQSSYVTPPQQYEPSRRTPPRQYEPSRRTPPQQYEPSRRTPPRQYESPRTPPRQYEPPREAPPRQYEPSRGTPSRQYEPSRGTPSRQYEPSRRTPPQQDGTPQRKLPDFEKLHPKPCLKLIPSETSIVKLSRPLHCIFNETTREWVISDKEQGVIFLNKDCYTVLRRLTCFNQPSATVLLNDNHHLGVLECNGIFIYDFNTGTKRQIFNVPRCRGLAITSTGDFVTVNPKTSCIYIVPQNGETPVSYSYVPLTETNQEGERPSPSFVSVCRNRIVVVDYTIASFNLYKYNPETRDLTILIKQDCAQKMPQSRLTCGFMDSKGRIIVSNCKERSVMLYDHDGKFLQRIPCDQPFARPQYICVNRHFQAIVLDSSQKPHSAKLYQIIADPPRRWAQLNDQLTEEASAELVECKRLITLITIDSD